MATGALQGRLREKVAIVTGNSAVSTAFTDSAWLLTNELSSRRQRMWDFTDVSVVPTGPACAGGGNGIGAVISRRLAGDGARVVVVDIAGSAAEEVPPPPAVLRAVRPVSAVTLCL
jgi:hypothetical protein